MLIILVVDAYEGTNVAIVDIPGAYLNTGKPKDRTVLLKLKGKFVDNVQCGQLIFILCYL